MEKQFKVKERCHIVAVREILVTADSKEKAIQKVKDNDPNIEIINTQDYFNPTLKYEAIQISEK